MTKNQVQKRVERSQNLKVVQVNDETFYVESSGGKICYRVLLADEATEYTCGDFVRNVKADQNFKCKHILAVYNSVPLNEVNAANILEKKMPKLKEQFLINIKGKDFVLYSGLLDLAHQKGIMMITVNAVQLPNKENGNEAICKATVVSKTGEEFEEWGDANPKNVNPMIAGHILRMAATRAKARALRDFTNIGMTCLEELGDLNDVIGSNKSKPKASAPKQTAPAKSKPKKAVEKKETDKLSEETSTPEPKTAKPKKTRSAKSKKADDKKSENEQSEKTMSEAQKRAIFSLSRRRGISIDELENMSDEMFNMSVESLSNQNASAFIRSLQQAA